MASQSLALNDTPQDVFSALSLDASISYTVQNTGDRRAYFWESDNAPVAAAVRAMFIEPGGDGSIDAPATGALWFWSDEPTTLGVIEAR